MQEIHSTLHRAAAFRSQYPNKKIAFVSGIFNVLHPGHLRLLKFATDLSDLLVVGVLPDKNAEAVVPEDDRIAAVEAIAWVDKAYLLSGSPSQFIHHLKPDLVIKGKEHQHTENPEAKALKSFGGKLVFSSGHVSFSLEALLQRSQSNQGMARISHPETFMLRHGFNNSDILQLLRNIKKQKAIVIGDIIIDEYITCDALGLSQEDPTIAVTPIATEQFLGGAGIVAAHARQFGTSTEFISICGNDQYGKLAEDWLKEYGVNTHLFTDDSRPTNLKQRYRCQEKTLLRVNQIRQHPIPLALQDRVYNTVLKLLPEADLIIFSDFSYGCLPQGLVNKITQATKSAGKHLTADSQSSSQIGDISRFKGMNLVTPTEHEARIALKDKDSGLVSLAETLHESTECPHAVMTLGAEGMFIHTKNNQNQYETDRLVALNQSPVDPAGAGDSLLAAMSMAISSGADIWQSAYLGALTAAHQVARLGNKPISITALESSLADQKTLRQNTADCRDPDESKKLPYYFPEII